MNLITIHLMLFTNSRTMPSKIVYLNLIYNRLRQRQIMAVNKENKKQPKAGIRNLQNTIRKHMRGHLEIK